MNVSRIELQFPSMTNKNISLTVMHFFFQMIRIETSPDPPHQTTLKFMYRRTWFRTAKPTELILSEKYVSLIFRSLYMFHFLDYAI